MDKLIELVLLLEERATLQDDLHSKRLLRSQLQIGADLSQHGRDRHNLCWDPESFLEFLKRRDAEIYELDKKLVENKKRIDELKKEFAVVAA
ncbi:MAG: hypothetical protein Q8Q46_03255 [Candidatus Giovannonibacteria bacterium]|nr:hypothetical protein [Candidatus Giovannonibacteria bacterium]